MTRPRSFFEGRTWLESERIKVAGSRACCSFSFEGSELGGTARGLNSELVAVVVLSDTGIDHLRHQVRGHLASLVLLLQNSDFLLELGYHGQRGRDIGLFLCSGFFVGLDLLLCPSSLGGVLQEVG